MAKKTPLPALDLYYRLLIFQTTNTKQPNMDLNSLKDQVSNLTLYDLKAGVRKVQNGEPAISTTAEYTVDTPLLAVMNYTEMEAKVGISDVKPHGICS